MSDQVKSPCDNTCQLDEAQRVCIGCGRTIEEVIGWQVMSISQKRRVVSRSCARLHKISKQRSEKAVSC